MASMTLEQALAAALRLAQAGRLEDAERIYRQILVQHADCADAEHLLGVLYARRGDTVEGIQLIRRAIARRPEVATFHVNLGNVLFSLGRIDESADCYRRALAMRADSAEAWANLGSALNEKRQFGEAVECATNALAIRADFAEAIVVHGNGLSGLGRVNDAIERFTQAIALKPDLAEAHNNLALTLMRRRRFSEALAALEKVVGLRPTWALGWSNRTKVLRHMGNPAEAETSARRSVELEPALAGARVNLAGALMDLGRIDEAVESARRAVELGPERAESHNILANTLKEAGRAGEAVDEFERAVQLDPASPVDLSNKLYVMEFDPRFDARQLFEEQRRWNRQYGEPLKKFWRPFHNVRSEVRRLKVGYVSPYFHSHAESLFVAPLLEAHDRERFEIHCYSDAAVSDEVTERLKRSADAWDATGGMTAEELATRIRSDGIDILVDLAMHMAFNRAETFARKPALVQVAWLAYPGGTGMDAMDYRISDPWIDPPGGDESVYIEKTVRLPQTWICYDPMSDAAPATPREAGPIRFGSLNNPCKLSEPVLRLWARVMRDTNDSRLLVQAISGEHRRWIAELMRAEGIAEERIEFLDRSKREEYLRMYDRIDIGLDPVPYNGITTTCDALWMGVPVVTLTGRTAAGRAGRSILKNVGLEELAAGDGEQFVRIAAELTGNLARLAELRATLRGRIAASPMMDREGFARSMETAYLGMWRKSTKGKSAIGNLNDESNLKPE